jgi:hypothetical protein
LFGLFNFVLKLNAMTLEEYEQLEQDFYHPPLTSGPFFKAEELATTSITTGSANQES